MPDQININLLLAKILWPEVDETTEIMFVKRDLDSYHLRKPEDHIDGIVSFEKVPLLDCIIHFRFGYSKNRNILLIDGPIIIDKKERE